MLFAHAEIDAGRTKICCTERNCAFEPSSDVLVEFLGYDLFQKLKANKLQNRLNFSCPICESKKVQLALFDMRILNSVEIECQDCTSRFCLICFELLDDRKNKYLTSLALKPLHQRHRHHYSHSCKDLSQRKFRNYVLDINNAVRPCPHCFRFSNRIAGCHNMVCSGSLGCNEPYCWECLAKENHPQITCQNYQIISPSKSIIRALKRQTSNCQEAVRFVGNAAITSVKAGILLLMSPIILYYRKIKDRQFNLQLEFSERLTQRGIDAYILPYGVQNSPSDHIDEEEAVNFVQLFAEENGQNGRWSDDHRCYLSYNCLDGAVLVRIHPHGPNDNRCNTQVQGSVRIPLDIDDSDLIVYQNKLFTNKVDKACSQVTSSTFKKFI